MLIASLGLGRSAAELCVSVSRVPPSTISIVSLPATRFLIMKLLVGAAIGLCAGALIGGLSFAALTSDTTTTAFVRLPNPADLTAMAAGTDQITPGNQANTGTFVAGEIAYLSGDGFAQALANGDPANLNIAQASESSTVSISKQWVMGVVLGALVGGSCGAAVVLARRRRSGRGSLVTTVTDEVDGVLLPAVDLDIPPRDAWADEQARLGRTLYAQCPSAVAVFTHCRWQGPSSGSHE